MNPQGLNLATRSLRREHDIVPELWKSGDVSRCRASVAQPGLVRLVRIPSAMEIALPEVALIMTLLLTALSACAASSGRLTATIKASDRRKSRHVA